MDIEINDEILGKMLARLERMTSDEIVAEVESFRGRSVGSALAASLFDDEIHFALSDEQGNGKSIEWGSDEFQGENFVVFNHLDAANDDSYALAA